MAYVKKMPKFYYRLFAFIILSVTSGILYAQDITLVNETSESITIDINVYGVKDKECVGSAIPYAYYTVFFRGFPDSINHKDPLVGTDESFVNNHKDYFMTMESGRFDSFITSVRLVNYNKKTKPKTGTVRLTINTRALKRDLEQQGVKRRFGL